MAAITVESNIPTVEQALERLVASIPAEVEASITTVAPAIKDVVQGIIEAHTPYATHEGEGEGVHLRDTTGGELIPGPESAEIVFRQTKTIPWRGHDDLVLADLLTKGGKGPYDIGLIDPENGPKALHWERGGTHFFAHAVYQHPAMTPHPYIAEAIAEAGPAVERVLDAAGAHLAFEVLSVMRA